LFYEFFIQVNFVEITIKFYGSSYETWTIRLAVNCTLVSSLSHIFLLKIFTYGTNRNKPWIYKYSISTTVRWVFYKTQYKYKK